MKPHRKIGIAMAVCAAEALSPPAAAESGEPDTVFVTGSRTRLESRQIGSAVTVVTREQIQDAQILVAKNALQDVPGVQISNDRPGAVTSVYLRGADNDQVLVLLDGREIGDPSNITTQFQFDHLRAANIERIEVLRGNQSSLYGSDAIGGVINIITRRPTDDSLDFSVDAEGGSYATRRLDLSLAGDSGILDYRLGAGTYRADGPSRADPDAGPAFEDDAYDNVDVSGRLGVEISEGVRFEIQGFASETDADLDGIGQDATFLPSVAKDETLFAASLLHDAPGGRWHSELSLGRYEAERRYATSGDRLTGEKRNLRFSAALDATARIALAFGFDLEEESTNQLTSFSGSFVSGNDTESVFAEIAMTPLDALTLTLAARRDDNARFEEFDTHRVTGAWTFDSDGPEIKLRASWGTGAKAPGLYQLFDPSFGNAALGVEESSGYDVGVDLYWQGGASLELSYFSNDIENEIDFAFPAGYFNLGQTRARGVEAYAAVPLADRVDWSVSYTYLDARDRPTDAWLGRPRNAATTRISFDATDRLSLTARARYRSLNAASFGGATDSFVVVDLLGSFAFRDDVELYGRVVNVFDEDYQYEWGSSTYDLSVFAGVRIAY